MREFIADSRSAALARPCKLGFHHFRWGSMPMSSEPGAYVPAIRTARNARTTPASRVRIGLGLATLLVLPVAYWILPAGAAPPQQPGPPRDPSKQPGTPAAAEPDSEFTDAITLP